MSRLSIDNNGDMKILAALYELRPAISVGNQICAECIELNLATADRAAQCDDENKKEALDCSNHEPHHRTKHTIWSTLRDNKRGRRAGSGNMKAAVERRLW